MGKLDARCKLVFTLAYAGLIGSSSIYASSSSEARFDTSSKEFVRKVSDTDSLSSDMTLSDNYSYKNNTRVINAKRNSNLYQDAAEIFGEFRNLTEEEEKAYAKGLKKVSRSTGRKLKI